MTLEELKNYIKVDYSADDALVLQLQRSAVEYLLAAIDAEATEADFSELERFNLAVAMLVSHWYENRSATTTSNGQMMTVNEIPYAIKPMLRQLQAWYWLQERGDEDAAK